MLKNPVVVLAKAKGCSACTHYETVWPKIQQGILKINSQTKFIVIEDCYNWNPNTHPKSLLKHITFFPTLLMMRSDVWNESLKAMPNDYDFSDKIQIMNKREKIGGKWKDEYKNMDVNDNVRWFKDSLERSEYKNPQTQVKRVSIEDKHDSMEKDKIVKNMNDNEKSTIVGKNIICKLNIIPTKK